MKKIATIALAVLCGGLFASGSLRAEAAKETAGEMTVSDRAGAFTEAGIKKAKDAFHDTTFHGRVEFHIEAYAKVPENKHADYDKVKNDPAAKKRFFGDWANELAKAHKSKGIFLLISREGGHVHAIDDRQADAKRSFDDAKLHKLEEKVAAGFQKATKVADPEAAKKTRDEGLLDATNYLIAELKDTMVPVSKEAVKQDRHDGGNKGTSSIWSYVCIGAIVLLGIWLVVGIFRALTNRGGGGYGGGGGGYGGGGGGFMSGMLGGLFGGMAGMWMYNNMFGGSHASDMSAGQGGDYGGSGGDYNDTGAGDYDGGGDGGGTSFDDGGGGDWGDTGGGGDWGGGGDFGGGGDW